MKTILMAAELFFSVSAFLFTGNFVISNKIL
jgi:hypothetical protein